MRVLQQRPGWRSSRRRAKHSGETHYSMGLHATPHIHHVDPHNSLGSLLTRSLPAYSGPYSHSVGCTDVEIPIDVQRFGNFTHRRLGEDAEAGIAISTVLFTLFYPCRPQSVAAPLARWYPKLGQTTDGFLRMAGKIPSNWWRAVTWPGAWLAVAGTTFPCFANAPLLPHPEGKKYKLLIFSHGVGCSRLMYSAFCGEMASRGYIVAALEHRDGSGPSSTTLTADGSSTKLDWLSWTDLEWPDLEKQPLDDTTLRHVQLDVRLAELAETIKVLKRLNDGFPCVTTGIKIDLSSFIGALDAARPIMSGHSFGGTLAIAAASDSRFDLSHVIVSDPACQRLAPWKGQISVPFVSINSEQFMLSKENEEMMDVYRSADSHARAIFSVTGSNHPSFSDVFLILPNFLNSSIGLRATPLRIIRHFVHVAELAITDDVDKLKEQAVRVEAHEVLRKAEHGAGGHLLYHDGIGEQAGL